MKIKKYQDGGVVAPVDDQMATQEMGQQDPLLQLAEMSAQALQTQNCELGLQVCEAFLMLLQQAEGAAPVGEPQGEPVFKKGGKMVKAEGVGIKKSSAKYSRNGNKNKKSCK